MLLARAIIEAIQQDQAIKQFKDNAPMISKKTILLDK